MRNALRIIAGIAVSGVCLYFAFRAVPLRQSLAAAANAPAYIIPAFFALATVTLALRSMRWRLLLEASGPVPLSVTFALNAAGQLGNNILPARLGDVFRATNVGRAGVNSGFALATVLVERVLDAGFLVLVTGLVLGTLAALPPWLARGAYLVTLAAAAGLTFALILPRFGPQLLNSVDRFSPARWRAILSSLASQFLQGLRSLHHLRRVISFLLLTAVIWMGDCLNLTVLAHGFGMELSPTVVITFITVAALSSALPAAPGNVGVYQLVAIAVLGEAGFGRAQVLGYTVVVQVLALLTLLFWGLGGVWFLSARNSRTVPVPAEA